MKHAKGQSFTAGWNDEEARLNVPQHEEIHHKPGGSHAGLDLRPFDAAENGPGSGTLQSCGVTE